MRQVVKYKYLDAKTGLIKISIVYNLRFDVALHLQYNGAPQLRLCDAVSATLKIIQIMHK